MADELIRRSDVIDAIHSRNKALLRDEPYRRKRGDIDLLGVIDYINAIPTIEAEPVKHSYEGMCKFMHAIADDTLKKKLNADSAKISVLGAIAQMLALIADELHELNERKMDEVEE